MRRLIEPGRFQNPTLVGYRINQRDAITTTKVAHFALDGGEIAGLNLNDLVAAQNVDNVKSMRGIFCNRQMELPGQMAAPVG